MTTTITIIIIYQMNTNNEEYTMNDQMLLEMILLMIRGEKIKYNLRKKKEKEKLQKQLEEEIA